MESPYCIQKEEEIQRKEATKRDKSDERTDIYKSESCIGLTKKSGGPLVSKSRKKHCDWMKSTSDIYCPNTELFKNYHVHRKIYDRLKKYVKDELRTFDLPQKCETLSR